MTPKTNATAPSRRRAKTMEEIEQHRLERILRNRKAAQASREKKRKYVKSLEDSISDLKEYIEALHARYRRLCVSCEFNSLNVTGLKPIDGYIHNKNIERTGIITSQKYQNRSLEGYSHPTNSGDYQNQISTLPTTSPESRESSAIITNRYPKDNLQSTGEALTGTTQYNLAFESNEDRLYYSYLSRVSMQMPWEKQMKESDKRYP